MSLVAGIFVSAVMSRYGSTAGYESRSTSIVPLLNLLSFLKASGGPLSIEYIANAPSSLNYSQYF